MEFNWLRLHVTSVCNFSCPHCHIYVYNEPNTKTKMMSSETFESSVLEFTQVLRRHGHQKTRVSVYGGEPFVNKKVVLGSISRLGTTAHGVALDWVINTNGSLIQREDLATLKDHDVEIHLSLDGKEKIHNISRKTLGGGDTFERVLRTLNMLRSSGIRTQFNSHVMPSNANHLYELVDLANEFGVSKIYLDLSYTPQGLEVTETLKKYRDVYFYGLRKGVSILGSWSEVIRNQQRPLGRDHLIDRNFGIEVTVDGEYFFPTRIESKGQNRFVANLGTHLEDEIRDIRLQLKAEYLKSCASCRLKRSCLGTAKEHVRYHLDETASTETYCEFYRQWIAELNQDVFSLKTESFIITGSGERVSPASPLVQALQRAHSELRSRLPRLIGSNKNPIHVHLASDFSEFAALAGNMEIPSWTRMFANGGRLFILGSEDLHDSSLRHELLHVVFQRAGLRLPAWFEEGSCQLMACDQLFDLNEANEDIIEELIGDDQKPLIHWSSLKISENAYYQTAQAMLSRLIREYFDGRIETFWQFLDHGYPNAAKTIS